MIARVFLKYPVLCAGMTSGAATSIAALVSSATIWPAVSGLLAVPEFLPGINRGLAPLLHANCPLDLVAAKQSIAVIGFYLGTVVLILAVVSTTVQFATGRSLPGVTAKTGRPTGTFLKYLFAPLMAFT